MTDTDSLESAYKRTQKFLITIPINGLPFKLISKIQVDDVTIELRKSGKDDVESPMASVELESEPNIFNISAAEKIDKALAKISYIYASSITRSNEVYITLLDSIIPPKGWGWHNYAITTKAYAIFDYQSVLASNMSKIANMPAKKQLVFNKAIALYREALGLRSPNLALIAYFSCVTAIVRDMRSSVFPNGHIPTSVLKDCLRCVANMKQDEYSKLIDQMYNDASGRSATDHGWIDITDPLTVGNATRLASILRHWTRLFIIKYVEENQLQNSAIAPKS